MSVKRYFLALLGFYLIVGTLFTVNSCTTVQRAQEIDEQRQVAVAGIAEREAQISALEAAVKQGAEATTRTIEVLNTEMGGLRDELAEQVANAEPGSEKWKEGVLAFIDAIRSDRDGFLGELNDANTKLQSAEDGWGMAEALFSIAGGFFPPAALGGLLIGRGRKVIRQLNQGVLVASRREDDLNAEIVGHIADFNGVVDAMAAGGGPVNKADATSSMLTVAGLKDRVTDRRVEIGNKVLKAVATT